MGPTADNEELLLGNYHGHPSHVVTPLQALRDRLGVTKTSFVKGCDIDSGNEAGFAKAGRVAVESRAVIMFLGLNQTIEGEGKDRFAPTSGSDLKLPSIQVKLFECVFKAIQKSGKYIPLVVFIMSGGPIYIPVIAEQSNAVLLSWYGGQAAGIAVANIVYGSVSPSGRLPVSVYTSEFAKDSSLLEMSMCAFPGKTYRYICDRDKYIQYPFGYGLTYSKFKIENVSVNLSKPLRTVRKGPSVAATYDENPKFKTYIAVKFTVANIGKMFGSYMLQVYATYVGDNGSDSSMVRRRCHIPKDGSNLCKQLFPYKTLVGFEKIFLHVGEEKEMIHYIELQRIYVYDVKRNTSSEFGMLSKKDLEHKRGVYELQISGGFLFNLNVN